MPAGNEDDADLSAGSGAPVATTTSTAADPGSQLPVKADPRSVPRDHHVLLDAEEDRWRWRAKIRRDPRKLFFYRMGVGLLGTLMICLGLVTGPLPGPGGIPLVLLGLAIWASEFEWAHKLMMFFKAQLARFRRWPRSRQIGSIALCCVIGALCGYLYLLLMGVPFWAPDFLRHALELLPGV